VQIPVAVKLSPYFTSFASVARKFVQQGGADALAPRKSEAFAATPENVFSSQVSLSH
jgi:hypothetical protein